MFFVTSLELFVKHVTFSGIFVRFAHSTLSGSWRLRFSRRKLKQSQRRKISAKHFYDVENIKTSPFIRTMPQPDAKSLINILFHFEWLDSLLHVVHLPSSFCSLFNAPWFLCHLRGENDASQNWLYQKWQTFAAYSSVTRSQTILLHQLSRFFVDSTLLYFLHNLFLFEKSWFWIWCRYDGFRNGKRKRISRRGHNDNSVLVKMEMFWSRIWLAH